MHRAVCVIIASASLGISVSGQDVPYMQGKRFAVGDYTSGKVCIVEADGSVSWQQKAPNCNDLWILPERTILFTTGRGVREVAGDGTTKFEYTSSSEIYAVQRLANGNTFVGECSAGRLLEIAPDGTVAKTVQLQSGDKPAGHAYMRNARALPNGHYLVAHYGAKQVTEYGPDGTALWNVRTPGGPHSVTRLAGGNTMIACADNGTPCLLEVNPAGETVWKVSNDDLPDKPFRFLTGFQKLPNGNVLVSNWLGHGKFGTAPHLMEITPAKKVVWSFSDHKTFRTIATVQVFADGDVPLSGDGTH